MLTDIRYYKDETLNDALKTWVVPDGENWAIKYIFVDFAAGVGGTDRLIVVEVLDTDGTTTIFRVSHQNSQAAGTTYRYIFAPHVPTHNTQAGVAMPTGMPELIIGAGRTLRVRDQQGIALTTDDMLVYFLVEVHTV